MDWDAVSELCTSCGMCCDGTLFGHANIKNDDDLKLASSLGLNTLQKNGRDTFELPCHHFSSKCTIYGEKRPNICGAFFCQPIRDIKNGRCDLSEANDLVSRAVKLREQFSVACLAYPEFASQSIFKIRRELHLNGMSQAQQVGMRKKYAPLYLIGARLFPLLNAIAPRRKKKL
ncbi:YkgJ family cysteine cluster protein [Mariprofundus sp. KV]|uniref:YkgJ family cysteine cluster protein n=1 Tax=Mariprofundus sp. KV TaxID=2608715 RepID=UPI0015A09588|nr:YkgJ family cysteine cluster protein [Mariprofundus sp. KV]NWF35521.1 hypothetical protein [Mariprofundus sp. KV]